METIVGFAVGYLLGTRHGREGWHEVVASWAAIRSSEDVKALLARGVGLGGSLLRDALERGGARAGSGIWAAAQGKLPEGRRLAAV